VAVGGVRSERGQMAVVDLPHSGRLLHLSSTHLSPSSGRSRRPEPVLNAEKSACDSCRHSTHHGANVSTKVELPRTVRCAQPASITMAVPFLKPNVPLTIPETSKGMGMPDSPCTPLAPVH